MEKTSNSNPFNNSLLVPIAVSCIVLLPAKGEVLAGEKKSEARGKDRRFCQTIPALLRPVLSLCDDETGGQRSIDRSYKNITNPP